MKAQATVLIFAVVTTWPATAADISATCPLTLPVEAVAIRAPPGWIGHNSDFVRLTGAGMMAGPPETLSYLVPSTSKKIKGGGTSTWDFERTRQKWLFCLYDNSAAIQISRQLGGHATTCTMKYTKTSAGHISSATVTCP